MLRATRHALCTDLPLWLFKDETILKATPCTSMLLYTGTVFAEQMADTVIETLAIIKLSIKTIFLLSCASEKKPPS